MANNCQIPTPREYVLTMLDLLKPKDILYGKRILENSCGEGNILCEILRQYIQNSRESGVKDDDIKIALEHDIVGYETDVIKIEECKSRLAEVASEYGFSNIQWNIINEDYLTSNDSKYDIIIGNPPYITYHDMSLEQRQQLFDNYSSCKSGRYDYYYAFVEKSIDSLNDKGKLVYLVPYSILRNKFAGALRKKVKPLITEIHDYEGIQIFEDIISSSIIIVCENDSNQDTIMYHSVKKKITRNINKSELEEKWFFSSQRTGRRFGDYFDISNSVATLKNDVFILKDNSIDIEESICFPAVSAKSIRTGEELKIIVPYDIGEGYFKRYSESDFCKKYPKAYKYLLEKKELLDGRDKSQNNEWYEYGRSQALNQIIGEKLVLSMVVTNKVNVYLCENNEVPFAGYFIKKKQGSKLTLQYAKTLLESKAFYEYAKEHGTPTTPTSYRLSVKEIQNYIF